MPGAATVQPARLARGLRRVALEQGIADPRADHARRCRTTALVTGAGPIEIATTSARGRGRARGRSGRRRDERLGGGLAAGRAPAPHVVELHRPDRADPGPARGDRLDRRRRHRPTRASPSTTPGRPPTAGSPWAAAAAGPGGGGRIGRRVHRGRGARPGARPTASGAGSRAWPTSGSTTRGAARSTSPTTIGRGSGRGRAAGSITGSATAATASRRRSSAGGSSRRSRRAGRVTTRPRACRSSATGRRRGHFRPEPLRGVGARVFRAAMVRREEAEEAGRAPSAVIREITRIPRRLGYHLGPE